MKITVKNCVGKFVRKFHPLAKILSLFPEEVFSDKKSPNAPLPTSGIFQNISYCKNVDVFSFETSS